MSPVLQVNLPLRPYSRDVTGKSIDEEKLLVKTNFFQRIQQQAPQGIPIRD